MDKEKHIINLKEFISIFLKHLAMYPLGWIYAKMEWLKNKIQIQKIVCFLPKYIFKDLYWMINQRFIFS
jgi:hypothetical protein